jgi:hypothetical protein
MIHKKIIPGTNPLLMTKSFLISLALLFSLGSTMAQKKYAGKAMPLFQSDEILNLTLKADFKEVFNNTDDSTYFPAIVTLSDNDGQKMSVDVEIRTRGRTRRKKSYCRFTPVRVKFPKKEMENTPFEGQKAIKLVTHCNKADHFEQNTVLEYLIYKTFNILTDSSFKVRPVIFNYVDTGKKPDSVQKFAFFIEREKHLANRLRGIEIETDKVHPAKVNQYQACLVDIFQYMIGNTDYSIFELHNGIIIADSSSKASMIPVPYDFDWCGLVSAPYAKPNPKIGTEYVTERVYRGIKREEIFVSTTIKLFNARKQEIYQLFENFEFLEDSEEKKAIKYLDEFYETINNERMVKKEFFEKARSVN